MTPTLMRVALAATVICSTRAHAQSTRPAPIPLTSAEATAILDRHAKATTPTSKKHKYLHIITELIVGESLPVRTEYWSAAPDKVLTITTIPGSGTIKAGYDGKYGWTQSPATGVVRLEGEPLRALRATAALTAHLARPDTSAIPVQQYFLGHEVFEGRPARGVLSVTAASDSLATWFDVETGLMAAMHGGQRRDSTTLMLFDHYKRFDGALIPTKTTVRSRDREFVTRILKLDHARIDAAKFSPHPAVRALWERNP